MSYTVEVQVRKTRLVHYQGAGEQLVAAIDDNSDGLVLYGTSACHLCEVAREMLEQYKVTGGKIDYTRCDISDSDELFQRYGLKIPVLRRADGGELDWPFSMEELLGFLA